MPKFIEAVNRATGKKQRIPAHWLDHPSERLSGPFKLTAQSRKKAEAEEALQTPDPDPTVTPEAGITDKG